MKPLDAYKGGDRPPSLNRTVSIPSVGSVLRGTPLTCLLLYPMSKDLLNSIEYHQGITKIVGVVVDGEVMVDKAPASPLLYRA